MATNRIYKVTQSHTDKEGVTERLVRAASAAQAIKHVVKPIFTAAVASQDDLIALAKTCAVEEAAD